MTIREQWFRLMVRAFPKDYRAEYEDEIIDVMLDVSPSGLWAGVTESLGLVRAGLGVSERRDATGRRFRTAVEWGAAIWLGLLLGAGAFVRPMGAAIMGGSAFEFLANHWTALGGAVLLGGAVVVAGRVKWLAGLTGVSGLLVAAFSNSNPYWTFPDSFWYEVKWLAPALIMYIALTGRASRPPGWAVTLPSAAAVSAVLLVLGSANPGYSYSTVLWIDPVRLMAVYTALLAVGLVWVVPSVGAMAIVPIAHLTAAMALPMVLEGAPPAASFIGIFFLTYFALATYLTLRRRQVTATLKPG